MNADQVKGNWKQLQGRFKQQWGKLTEDDLTQAQGRSDVLVGKIQERYGKSKEEAKREFDSFISKL